MYVLCISKLQKEAAVGCHHAKGSSPPLELMATSWWHVGHSQHLSCNQPDMNGSKLWWEIQLKKCPFIVIIYKFDFYIDSTLFTQISFFSAERCPYISWITFIMFQYCFHILFNPNQIISNNEFLLFNSFKLNLKWSTCFVNYLTACLIWQI